MAEERKELVGMLLEERFDEADKMVSTLLYENESTGFRFISERERGDEVRMLLSHCPYLDRALLLL